MMKRAKKWWLIGAAAWLVFGLSPVLYDPFAEYFDWVLLPYSVAGGLGVLSALLIHPGRPRWAWSVATLIWCFGWFYWFGILWTVSGHVVTWLINTELIMPSTGSLGNFDHEISIVLIVSAALTVALLVGLTRSTRVALITSIPVLVYTAEWVTDIAVPLSDHLWHPIVIGALILWAVPKRIHPFPAHACQSCGYDLRGLEPATKCPECGNTGTIRGAMGKS